ncbi:fungal-specific transcription factor domain-containing protein [Ilyonectria robusta]|uniref:fungal-specific transcription factor domain-containing protein n=1 Tax=Ilyonectria robusta TaxID=1079257 RepID=UPI001E8CCFE9|nr:fungal-specific transcription factor domain-containing protein [Ilyonectria robusta]KAH8667895.1 fungal-specific transcription factor domain-containing protein [Ilyonectria robusta]
MANTDPVASDKDAEEKAKPRTRMRKRARKACLSCRSRKVRCDVSQRGRPCMNCYLDNDTCVVTGRASKFALLDPRDSVQASYPPYAAIDQQSDEAHEGSSAGPSVPGPVLNNQIHGTQEPRIIDEERPEHNDDTIHHDITDGMRPDPTSRPENAVPVGGGVANPTASQYVQPEPLTWLNSLTSKADSQPKANTGSNSEVVHCFYPFLAVSNLHNVPHQDVNFLELQGCLRVPIRPLLDDFMRQYFLHVHPILPLINEGDFWDMYCHEVDEIPTGRISLLVFQAILFASCNFVSPSTMEALAYATIREMRASFQRRAKLLFDMGTETSDLALSQAAVLLSYTSLSSAKKVNTSWLSLAINYAKSADAHLYAAMPASHCSKQQAILRRLWWCCVLRDHSVGLLMRRPIQITMDQFDYNASPLGVADLDDEFQRSRVYNPETKKALAEVFAQSIQLNVVVTDILMLCFPLQGWNQAAKSDNAARSMQCKRALNGWYEQATLRLAIVPGDNGPRSLLDDENSHESITLYRNLMLMHYYTSQIALCHHEVLSLETLQGGVRNTMTKDMSVILDNQRELQAASRSLIECHKQLVGLNLARWLPLPAIGCTLLPLILNILDIKLSAPLPKPGSNPNPAHKQRELNTLIEVMKTYQPQYDGVDWVSEIVRHVVNLAQLDNLSPHHQKSTIDWTHIFALQPSSYLRLALALDLGLSKGRIPQDKDFPMSLRGIFAVGISPIKELVQPRFPIYHISSNQMNPNFYRGIDVPGVYGMEPTQRMRLPFNPETDQINQPHQIVQTAQDNFYVHWPSMEFQDTDMSMSDEIGDLVAGPDEIFSLGESREADELGETDTDGGSSHTSKECVSGNCHGGFQGKIDPGVLIDGTQDGNLGVI